MKKKLFTITKFLVSMKHIPMYYLAVSILFEWSLENIAFL